MGCAQVCHHSSQCHMCAWFSREGLYYLLRPVCMQKTNQSPSGLFCSLITNAGLHTIYAQQWHILRRRGDLDPDPRIQTVLDISKELAVHHANQRSICIVGGFNEVLGDDPALMAAACSKFGLVDVMDSLHPEDAHMPSYARSKNRLDYALVSKDLLPDVTHSGLQHYHEFYPSDHRPIFFGLNPAVFAWQSSCHRPSFGPWSE
jgi:hypothetical protein